MSLPAHWSSNFGHLLPVGQALRKPLISSRWLRVHSLPKSKRYPETEVEYAELLLRHNAVAAAVLGLDASCWLIVSRYTSAAETIDRHHESTLLGYSLGSATIGGRPPDDDKVLEFAVSAFVWSDGAIDHRVKPAQEAGQC